MLALFVRRGWLPLVGLVLALQGCSGGGGAPGETVGETESGLTANDKIAFDYFLAKGLTNFQAAGIVGNLDQESSMRPTAVQPGGPGRGIAQWSVGGRWDTGTTDNATAFAAKQGQSVWSLSLQLDFIWYELTTFSGYGLASLKKSANVTDATIVFERDFEGCGNCQEATRISYAKAALAAYGADAIDAGTPPVDAGPGHDSGVADAGHHIDGAVGNPPPVDQDASSVPPPGGDGGTAPPNGSAPATDDPGASNGGCAIAARGAGSDGTGAWLFWLFAGLALIALGRRRRDVPA